MFRLKFYQLLLLSNGESKSSSRRWQQRLLPERQRWCRTVVWCGEFI